MKMPKNEITIVSLFFEFEFYFKLFFLIFQDRFNIMI